MDIDKLKGVFTMNNINTKEINVTPEEAAELLNYCMLHTMIQASDIARYFQNKELQEKNYCDYLDVFCCLFNAGRIQGIREERAKRNR